MLGKDPYVPAGQVAHAASYEVDPVVDLETLPVGHEIHETWFIQMEYLPTGHRFVT